MHSSTPALIVGALGFLLWWGGYYGAMRIAWRAGVRRVGLAVFAVAMGVCGCFGIPLLAYFWSQVQSETFAAIDTLPDDEPVPQHMNHFRIAAGIAVVGLVLQTFAGYMLPDDDGYDDYSYSDDYADDDYADDDYADDDYADDDYADDDNADDRDPRDEIIDQDSLDEVLADEAEPSVEDASDVQLAASADEDPSEPEIEEPAPMRLEGLFLGAAPGRRHGVLLIGGRVHVVSRERRQRWPRIEPGTTVSAVGPWTEDALVASEITELDDAPWTDLPNPFVVRSSDPRPLEELAGQYVLLAAPHADSRTRLSFPDGTQLTARAPRGALERGADYTAVRGVLIDTSTLSRRSGLELWILRPGDVVGL